MHAAGVLHCDLYFSNVMWRSTPEDSVEIKLIDFDCSHLLSEHDFAPRVRKRFVEYFGQDCFTDASEQRRRVVFDKSHDLTFVSIVELEVTTANTPAWHALASNHKQTIDPAFRSLLAEALAVDAILPRTA